tara:strand:- start:318 stop:485 length:168 start_codon:yes stop_codon:yes gene_type:complete
MPKDVIDTTFDKRLITRNLENGSLSRKGLESHLADLPDLSEEAEAIELGDEVPGA